MGNNERIEKDVSESDKLFTSTILGIFERLRSVSPNAQRKISQFYLPKITAMHTRELIRLVEANGKIDPKSSLHYQFGRLKASYKELLFSQDNLNLKDEHVVSELEPWPQLTPEEDRQIYFVLFGERYPGAKAKSPA